MVQQRLLPTKPGPEVPRIIDIVWDGDVAKQEKVVEELHAWSTAERERLRPELESLPNVAQFHKGRDFLLTGASGFLGRVYLEQLLYYCPDVRNVYLLLRPKKGVAPEDRIEAITNVELFSRIRRERPDALKKLVVLPGDCSELGLGLSAEHRKLVQENVSFIVHSAASVRFDDRVKKAVLLNLRGTRELVELARGMKKLKAFLHVSTAYTNINQEPVEERVYRQHLDYRTVIKAAERDDHHLLDYLGSRLLGYHYNTYTWTKALAEDLIEDAFKELPVAILRPTIVISTVYDPFIGWIDNINGPAAIFLGAVTGVLRVAAKSEAHWDLVPVDICAKSMVLGTWMLGCGFGLSPTPEKIQVVNLSGAAFDYPDGKVLRERQIVLMKKGVYYPSAIRFPFVFMNVPKVVEALLFLWFHIIFALIADTGLRLSGRKPRLMSIYRKVVDALTSLKKFDRDFHFRSENCWAGLTVVHPDDAGPGRLIDWDAIMWTFRNRDEAIVKGAIGLSKFVMKSTEEDHKTAARKNYWLLFAEILVHLILFWLIYRYCCPCKL